jgi:hypothetical protein
MDLSSLRALVVELNFSAHGKDATVRRPPPDDDEIETRIIWMTAAQDLHPVGLDDQRFQPDFQRRDPVRILAIRRDHVPTAPRGTVITTSEWGTTIETTWRVDGLLEKHPDHIKVAVVRCDVP